MTEEKPRLISFNCDLKTFDVMDSTRILLEEVTGKSWYAIGLNTDHVAFIIADHVLKKDELIIEVARLYEDYTSEEVVNFVDDMLK